MSSRPTNVKRPNPTYRPLRQTSADLSGQNLKSNIPLLEQVPLRRSQSFPNLSVTFADGYAFWLYYLCILFVFWYTLFLFPFLRVWPALTIINIFHAILSFYFMHWKRGTADAFDAGRFDRYTFWEMLDDGKQYTPARKFFTVVPIVLFLMACYEHDWRKRYYAANVIALCASVIPKMPMMMGVRFLGINK
eukprot:32686_1